MADLDRIELCILRCACGCKEPAVSLAGTRITKNHSSGPWKVLKEFAVKRSDLKTILGIETRERKEEKK